MKPSSKCEQGLRGREPSPRESVGREGLVSWGFFGLVCLQFLTVLNDNTYRWLVTPIGYHLLGPQYESLILTLGIICFAVPYVVLVAPAGYLADRFRKRRVIAACMLLQAGILVFGMGSILITNATLVFTILAVMGAQGALLAPAMLGAIPETIDEEHISAANGVLGMASVLAAVVGTVLGNSLYVVTGPLGRTDWWISGSTMIGIALLGWAACLLIAKRPAADRKRPFPTRLLGQTIRDLKTLVAHHDLFAVALASAFLWFLAALAQVNVYLMGTVTLDITQVQVGPLLAVLAAGVAVGSVLAGFWSGHAVDPGLTPIGATVIVLSCIMMFLAPEVAAPESEFAYTWSCGGLFLMGMGAGIYDVPLRSYLQDFSPLETRGQILAAGNDLIFAAMLVAAGLFWVLTSWLGMTAPDIFLIAGVATAIATIGILYFVRRQTTEALMRPLHGLRNLLDGHQG